MRSRFRLRRPSAPLAISMLALFMSVGGIGYAAISLPANSVGTRQIRDNAVITKKIRPDSVGARRLRDRGVTTAKIRKNAVTWRKIRPGSVGRRRANLNHLQARIATACPAGQTIQSVDRNGHPTCTASKGAPGPPGPPGANPALAVLNVPPIRAGEDGAGGPNSGQAGDQGFFFTGRDAAGSARLAGGQLVLHGVGISIQPTPPQGAIGIAKTFGSVPLGRLDALSYTWHVNELNGAQAPTIHVTVTGLVPGQDSNFASGFANLVYEPANNGVTASNLTRGDQHQSDAFAANARWFTTGGARSQQPLPLSTFVEDNPAAVIHQIALDNGGSSGNTIGSFEAGADNLILGFTGSRFTRYDFDG